MQKEDLASTLVSDGFRSNLLKALGLLAFSDLSLVYVYLLGEAFLLQHDMVKPRKECHFHMAATHLSGVLCACDGIQTRVRVETKISPPVFFSNSPN